MKITFDYNNGRYYILLKNYVSLWEILECIEQQTGANEIRVR